MGVKYDGGGGGEGDPDAAVITDRGPSGLGPERVERELTLSDSRRWAAKVPEEEGGEAPQGPEAEGHNLLLGFGTKCKVNA